MFLILDKIKKEHGQDSLINRLVSIVAVYTWMKSKSGQVLDFHEEKIRRNLTYSTGSTIQRN